MYKTFKKSIMTKVLGLDLGTNSIGWAIVDRDEEGKCTLLDKGVHIFQDGVAHDKSGEKPAVKERTAARAARRHYSRRRLRKIELLKVLINKKLCPFLSEDDLNSWKSDKKYPMNEDFLAWQRTDDNKDRNPYHDRYTCLTSTLDLTKKEDRYTLGRALYHLNQRRGFLSNRKDSGNDSETGKVKSSINSLSLAIKEEGCHYLGEYYYNIYGHKKIRTNHTARNEHYKAEFDAICQKQNLPSEMVSSLERAIFYQRPLKSQKGLVGKCTFEKDKPRIPLSHPRFEEFRMWQFINSIRITPEGEETHALNQSEIGMIYPLFFRKSKSSFDFEDIAKKLNGKNNCYKFNYRNDTTVSGCPVIASILNGLNLSPSLDWDESVCSVYTKGDGKNKDQIINDIWHALFNFDDEIKLKAWLMEALQISEEAASSIVKAKFPSGYASLSLKAISKILPWLKSGLIYSEAVYLANISEVLPKTCTIKQKEDIEENIRVLLEDFVTNPLNKGINKHEAVCDYLVGACEGVHTEKLYHPSMIETYPKAKTDKKGRLHLGSPRTNAFKNPMAMRALFRLRALVNQLLDEGSIDKDTRINIEFARGLNDTNKRKAIEDYQKYLEKLRNEDRAMIKESAGEGYEPTEDDLLKYRLYEEQNHKCLYTGKQIGITKFIGANTEFDIEHTIPRSRGGDNSQMNKTLCDSHFNRFDKKAKIPSELPNHEVILERIKTWKEKAEDYDKQINFQYKKKSGATTKDEKDSAIRRIHYLKMHRDYWRGKYERFTMEKVPEGFSNRQGVDIGIIGKYAKMYLQTVFDRTYIVKGATTADFRKEWGLQKEYEKKERINHAHHCIDAITIACIGKKEYDSWKEYMLREENHLWGNGSKPVFEKPWPTFTEDVRKVPDSLIVSHYTPDNMAKQSQKKLRIRGIIQRNDSGSIKYCKGDTARGSLHLDTMYGAIKRDDEIKYVIRKSLDSISDKDIKNIVDDTVRGKVEHACEVHGNLKKAVEAGIWMNEEKHIPINKVRLYAPTITNPVSLKKHRDISKHEHKRYTYVKNEGNYCMAIYSNGEKNKFKLYSTLDAVKNYKEKGVMSNWIPKNNGNGYLLQYVLKPGIMVLFYEKDPSELTLCSKEELAKRLYVVTEISHLGNYGRIIFKHSQEARASSILTKSNGKWLNNAPYRESMMLLSTQLTCYVEGYNFIITNTGRIVFK